MSHRFDHPMIAYLAVALGVAVLYVTYLLFVPFFVPLFWGAVLAVLCYPVYRRVERRLGGRKMLSATLMTFAVLFAVLIPGLAIAFYFALEAADFFQRAQAFLGRQAAFFEPNSFLANYVMPVASRLGLSSQDIHSAAAFLVQWIGGFLVGLGTGLIGNLVSLIINVLLTLVALYFAFKDGPAFTERLKGLLPVPRQEAEELVVRLRDVVQASVFSTFTVAAAQGLAGGLAFWVLGLSEALFWGVVMGVVSLIPVAGAPVVWVPASFYLAWTGDWERAGALFAVGVFVIGTIDNLLRPALIHGRIRIHNFYLFFAILGGVYLMGFTGFLFGPIMVSLALTVLKTYEEHRDARAKGQPAPP